MQKLTIADIDYDNPEVADICPCSWGTVVNTKGNKKIVYCIFADECIKKKEKVKKCD